MSGKVLVVATSATKLLDGRGTGCWVEEVASPYLLWKEKGLQVHIASVAGGAIPWDEASTSGDFFTPEASTFMSDDKLKSLVEQTPSVHDVLAGGIDEYDAVFVPGGHGICFDGDNADLKALLEKFWSVGKVVSAVCHGPAALTHVKDSNGNPIVKGKQVAGFCNSEEVAVGKDKAVPFLLEDRLKELGGDYSKSDDWTPYAVASGKLVTGQNPMSSKKVAELVADLVLPGLKEPVRGKGEHEGLHHRPKQYTREHHHDHHDEHPRQGARHDAPDPTYARSSWHQTYRPPI